MKDSLTDFFGTFLVLVEALCFILMIGFAGGVDQDMLSISDGIKRIAVTVCVMVICGIALVVIAKNDNREDFR